MKQKISGQLFYKFFQCPHWIWYDLYADQTKPTEIPPLMQMIFEDGLRPEQKKSLLQSRPSMAERHFKEIDPTLYKDLDEAFYATLELMKQGENIYHGVLMDEHWVGMPDLLERRPISELGLPAAEIAPTFGKQGRAPKGTSGGSQRKSNFGTGMSNFGDYYYVAYDIKSTGQLRDEFKFQLVFYSLILERLQGIRPPQAYLINAQGEEQSFLVDDFTRQFDLNLTQLGKILDGEKPAPFLKSGCKRSPWYSLCLGEAQDCRDVSLIYRLNQMDQRQLYDIGIKTIDQFAAADLEVLRAQLENWHYDKLLRFHAQAQALVKNEMVVLKKSEFPAVDTEIYFDVESDPTQNIDYLLGLLIVERPGAELPAPDVELAFGRQGQVPNGTQFRRSNFGTGGENGDERPGTENIGKNVGTGTYKYWFADDKVEEGKNWQEFTEWLAQLRGSFAIYHYAAYERQVFDRLALRYGTSGEIITKFRDHTVDILRNVTDAVIIPTYFYGLKDVASYLGFRWRASDAGSAESVIWYDEYLKTKDPKLREKIIAYNEDDVRATLLVKDWLAEQKPKTTRETAQLPEE